MLLLLPRRVCRILLPVLFFLCGPRWAMGSATLVSERGFWSANLSAIHKVCFFNGLLYYIATALVSVPLRARRQRQYQHKTFFNLCASYCTPCATLWCSTACSFSPLEFLPGCLLSWHYSPPRRTAERRAQEITVCFSTTPHRRGIRPRNLRLPMPFPLSVPLSSFCASPVFTSISPDPPLSLSLCLSVA